MSFVSFLKNSSRRSFGLGWRIVVFLGHARIDPQRSISAGVPLVGLGFSRKHLVCLISSNA